MTSNLLKVAALALAVSVFSFAGDPVLQGSVSAYADGGGDGGSFRSSKKSKKKAKRSSRKKSAKKRGKRKQRLTSRSSKEKTKRFKASKRYKRYKRAKERISLHEKKLKTAERRLKKFKEKMADWKNHGQSADGNRDSRKLQKQYDDIRKGIGEQERAIKNAKKNIQKYKERAAKLEQTLPKGVVIVN